MSLRIYCDGACSGNPGPGGWAAVLVSDDNSVQIVKGSQGHTTNNRMELQSAIEGLKVVGDEANIFIYTDSAYLKNGITVWIKRWLINGWKSSGGSPIKNIDLWKELYDLSGDLPLSWKWVKAHSGDFYNEMADREARSQVY
ncbi:ribonuclease HI [Candidatus Cyrtobacter comes]|uniref:ribonuclease HI n=1 Tax=Candidatus Cyrtobacter comes TaxID=675776 RepID=UPI003977499C